MGEEKASAIHVTDRDKSATKSAYYELPPYPPPPFTKQFESSLGAYEVEVGDTKFIDAASLANRNLTDISEEDLDVIQSHLNDRTLDEALSIIRAAIVEHEEDTNLDKETVANLKTLCKGPPSGTTEEDWETEVKLDAFLIEDWSIYPEVRAVTRPLDEDETNCLTFRVVLLSTLWSCAGSVLDTFFSVRFPSISLSGIALQILLMYSAWLWCKMPEWSIPVWKGKRMWINKGPWTFKEQMLGTLMIAVSVASPYSQSAIIAQANNNFYGISEAGDFGYIILLTLSSTFMGFGIAGLVRVILVYPVKAIWFGTLPSIALSRGLVAKEKKENINGWKLKRSHFFWLFAWLSFGWYWITNFVFQGLSTFGWLSWIAPNNINLQAITGPLTGLGVNPIPTFDLNNILVTNPMVTPFYVFSNMFFGVIIGMIAIIILWYTNVRWTGYLPINTTSLFANNGKKFNVRKILNSKGNLDLAAFQKYSMPFWSAGNLVVYGAFFAFYPAVMVYALLNYWKPLKESFQILFKAIRHPDQALKSRKDRFCRAMSKYKEVPEWWYLAILAISLGLAIATVEHYKFTSTPVWTIFLALGLSIIFLIPLGYLFATTNQQVVINVIYELIIGYALPGNGNALMVAKVYGANFLVQADDFISNQKIAHYTSIPPRIIFWCQLGVCLCNCFVQSGILYWQTNNGIKRLCDPDNPNKFTCMSQRVYFNAAVQWGTIGPKRVFDAKGLYPSMKWCFLLGALYPLPFYFGRILLRRYAPRLSWLLNGVNEIVILAGSFSYWAPYNLMYVLSGYYFCILFNWFIKNRYPAWWSKYNYILYASLTVGIAYSALIMFFSTEYKHLASISWWGNNVISSTKDAAGTAVRLLIPSEGYFGPKPGSYP